ncbi:uncharacterized protein APUU_70112A [Aspergillus puulaauensis]|uniref:Uncharacterized protein n=1 Tax=Aspergillus puulaauensis TaxID=1220207 RepID=A0A7R8ARV9_9EURO|nr:uncharacterized protein APUU_70112A [Aspergillus puulaauensis]BCS28542.1 hypothetical protein APUU_70112A [Aspergillus puulaauensis]
MAKAGNTSHESYSNATMAQRGHPIVEKENATSLAATATVVAVEQEQTGLPDLVR